MAGRGANRSAIEAVCRSAMDRRSDSSRCMSAMRSPSACSMARLPRGSGSGSGTGSCGRSQSSSRWESANNCRIIGTAVSRSAVRGRSTRSVTASRSSRPATRSASWSIGAVMEATRLVETPCRPMPVGDMALRCTPRLMKLAANVWKSSSAAVVRPRERPSPSSVPISDITRETMERRRSSWRIPAVGLNRKAVGRMPVRSRIGVVPG